MFFFRHICGEVASVKLRTRMLSTDCRDIVLRLEEVRGLSPDSVLVPGARGRGPRQFDHPPDAKSFMSPFPRFWHLYLCSRKCKHPKDEMSHCHLYFSALSNCRSMLFGALRPGAIPVQDIMMALSRGGGRPGNPSNETPV